MIDSLPTSTADAQEGQLQVVSSILLLSTHHPFIYPNFWNPPICIWAIPFSASQCKLSALALTSKVMVGFALLQALALPMQTDSESRTALHYAVAYKHKEIFYELLASGADLAAMVSDQPHLPSILQSNANHTEEVHIIFPWSEYLGMHEKRFGLSWLSDKLI